MAKGMESNMVFDNKLLKSNRIETITLDSMKSVLYLFLINTLIAIIILIVELFVQLINNILIILLLCDNRFGLI